jgi:hypothetical protein
MKFESTKKIEQQARRPVTPGFWCDDRATADPPFRPPTPLPPRPHRYDISEFGRDHFSMWKRGTDEDFDLWRSGRPQDIAQAIRNIGKTWKRPKAGTDDTDIYKWHSSVYSDTVFYGSTGPGFDDSPPELVSVDNPTESEITAAFGAILDLADSLGWPEPSFDNPANGADWTVRRAYRAALQVATAYCWMIHDKQEHRTGRTVRAGKVMKRNTEVCAAFIVISVITKALFDKGKPQPPLGRSGPHWCLPVGIGSALLAGNENFGMTQRKVAELVGRGLSTVQERERSDWKRIQGDFGRFCPTRSNGETIVYTSVIRIFPSWRTVAPVLLARPQPETLSPPKAELRALADKACRADTVVEVLPPGSAEGCCSIICSKCIDVADGGSFSVITGLQPAWDFGKVFAEEARWDQATKAFESHVKSYIERRREKAADNDS